MPDTKIETPKTLAEQIQADVSGTPEEQLQKLRLWANQGKQEQDKNRKIEILRQTHALVHTCMIDIEKMKDGTSGIGTEKLKGLEQTKDALGKLNEELLTERRKVQDTLGSAVMYGTEPFKRFGRADANTQMLVAGGVFAGLAAWFVRGKHKLWAVLGSLAAGVGLASAARYFRQEKSKPAEKKVEEKAEEKQPEEMKADEKKPEDTKPKEKK